MPELDLPTNADYIAVWALVDSGSPVHIVDAKQVFPNATVQPPPPNHRGFQGAGEELIKHEGFVTTTVRTREGGEQNHPVEEREGLHAHTLNPRIRQEWA